MSVGFVIATFLYVGPHDVCRKTRQSRLPSFGKARDSLDYERFAQRDFVCPTLGNSCAHSGHSGRPRASGHRTSERHCLLG